MRQAGLDVERGGDLDQARIILGLLQSVENDGAKTQRHLASELGIALGLVNSYLRRCISKGLLKVSKAPARRYSYYLTPRGFVEKSRLTVEYLSYSFEFFRRARTDYRNIFKALEMKGITHVALAGASDLGEIATLCAIESGVEVVAVVDRESNAHTLIGRPVIGSFEQSPRPIDAVVVTDMKTPQATWAACVARFGEERAFVPALLGAMVAGKTEASP